MIDDELIGEALKEVNALQEEGWEIRVIRAMARMMVNQDGVIARNVQTIRIQQEYIGIEIPQMRLDMAMNTELLEKNLYKFGDETTEAIEVLKKHVDDRERETREQNTSRF